MPTLRNIDLLSYSDLFHENSLGCIGTLWDTLERLEIHVAARGWSENVLQEALLKEAQVTKIMQEVLDGEERIAPGLTCLSPTAATTSKRKIA